jgi:hypothetical protein
MNRVYAPKAGLKHPNHLFVATDKEIAFYNRDNSPWFIQKILHDETTLSARNYAATCLMQQKRTCLRGCTNALKELETLRKENSDLKVGISAVFSFVSRLSFCFVAQEFIWRMQTENDSSSVEDESD